MDASEPRPPAGASPARTWQAQWYDEDAGHLVRPFAVTRGRTRPAAAEGLLDLISLVTAEQEGDPDEILDEHRLDEEHATVVGLCAAETLSVAEIASLTDLPVGVVRVLIGDLLDAGLVRVTNPVVPARLPDERILRSVIAGLRAL